MLRGSALAFALLLASSGGYAAAQELEWATQAGGTDTDSGSGIATDGSGNSYVTGTFSGTAPFGAGEAKETELTSSGSSDIFIAKYDERGRLLWATQAGGTDDDFGSGIATDGSGNSHVTGRFSGTATFGAVETKETELTSSGSGDIFIAKYDRRGRLLWATQAGGTDDDFGFGIATDGSGNSYVTGAFSDTATFGVGEANETELTSAGFGDIFVAKYDQDGRLLWATRAGGTIAESGTGVATDRRGNSYVTGDFSRTATFGAGEANETELTSAGRTGDIFIAKYDRRGRLLWVTQAGGDSGESGDLGTGVATDSRGNSYVTGEFWGTATFGAGEANETELTAAGPFGFGDIFVAKYDQDGRLLWATQAGGTDPDGGNDIATDRRGNSFITGFFRLTATFGAGEANETELTTDELRDIFIAKYDRRGRLLWATQAGGVEGDSGHGIATNGHGDSYVTGTFSSVATFGTGESNETELTTDRGVDDIFVAKYKQ